MIRVDKVLVPTDCSQVAVRIAGIVGELHGVKEVLLVHVIAASPFGSKDAGAGSAEAVDQVYRSMAQVRETLEQRGIVVRTIVETIGDDHVAGAILALAKREAASLIVLAPRST
jgi:nucleotide-binding universal stress UspA family protein